MAFHVYTYNVLKEQSKMDNAVPAKLS